jgi:hypothetical protein
MLAVGASLFATDAMSQEGQPCNQPGAIYTIGGRQYKCVQSLGQAHNPNWDGRSAQPNQPVNMGLPSGFSTQKAVFPGLSNDQYQKLQNSAEGQQLINQANSYRAQQAQAQKDFDIAAHSGNAQQLDTANRNLQNINTNLNNMQKKAQKILVELQ